MGAVLCCNPDGYDGDCFSRGERQKKTKVQTRTVCTQTTISGPVEPFNERHEEIYVEETKCAPEDDVLQLHKALSKMRGRRRNIMKNKEPPLGYLPLGSGRYQVRLDISNGLGISLGWTKDKSIVVAGFLDLPNGDCGPAEVSGLVEIGDQLYKVNNVNIIGRSLPQVCDLIREAPENLLLEFQKPHAHLVPGQSELAPKRATFAAKTA